MEDPNPENIVGQKRVTHSVEHQVPWGQVALGVGLLAVAYVGYKAFLSGSDGSDEPEAFDAREEYERATDIEVSGGGLTA